MSFWNPKLIGSGTIETNTEHIVNDSMKNYGNMKSMVTMKKLRRRMLKPLIWQSRNLAIPPKIMKGRQIVAMILESFRSSTQTDLMLTGKHLYELNYPEDSKLNLFRSQSILSAMREDDTPRDLTLRDILFDKIKGSSSMAFEIRYHKNLREGDSEKSYA